ncbi:MAG: DNA-directed RNA polymerase subunit alpha [Parcubacteria group bacterium GW2011_GWD2_38_12]|nr:MAG: DNA-directed RNA polymerase subunit alpha [Parcubacteria group bacterium GW2011_GWC2_36_17]KKQ39199.1 MAG: DNA-directed RNA polymerase subunit alpha [Candidatus Moranbacteria bacterium GW2011_GWF2_37_7]KKQ43226.1 MAG: DNA-directed RNA polymerase subunit alpha [Parcubacteria group bacterium GW2011_GWE2_37_8]KKQ52915.1 MAG: DNA-directed RNA polymerase subunit alpha [Parcubacteria group bacterium GW2011_GWD2_38_12]KKQ59118.1 MAG: DNA-directed RNA polymerase subunit alpha [Parcubacteria gro
MEITLPSKYKIIKSEGNSAVFEIENLYPGYGITIGNALRRVLLSSLKGASVTLVKIKGASHEFSTIPNIIEDVVEIILNLKQVRFKLDGDQPQYATLKVKGERKVTAKDIDAPSQVTVINKDTHIATLTDKKAELEIELTIEKGLGYVPVERRGKEKLEIGAIAIDAIYTPIRKVNYEVENMRVGDRTDFNRIKLLVETDGSISPEESFRKAINILIDQFNSLIQGAEVSNGKSSKEIIEVESKESIEDITKMKIEDLNLSTRTINTLTAGGVKTVGGLIKKTESGLREIDGMGDAGVKEIKKSLMKLGLSFREE